MTDQTGVITAFTEISSKLRRFVSRIVSPDDVEDIVQETFIKSYEADLKQNIEYTHSYMLKTAKHLLSFCTLGKQRFHKLIKNLCFARH